MNVGLIVLTGFIHLGHAFVFNQKGVHEANTLLWFDVGSCFAIAVLVAFTNLLAFVAVWGNEGWCLMHPARCSRTRTLQATASSGLRRNWAWRGFGGCSLRSIFVNSPIQCCLQ